MYYKKRTHLIAYIDGMIHSCLAKTITHEIAYCPNRESVLAKFIEKYELRQWQPYDEPKIHEQEVIERSSVNIYKKEK